MCADLHSNHIPNMRLFGRRLQLFVRLAAAPRECAAAGGLRVRLQSTVSCKGYAEPPKPTLQPQGCVVYLSRTAIASANFW